MIVRSRSSSAGRRFVYAYGYHQTLGQSVCDNALLAPMEAADRAVIARSITSSSIHSSLRGPPATRSRPSARLGTKWMSAASRGAH
jgi:hypothetical protein